MSAMVRWCAVALWLGAGVAWAGGTITLKVGAVTKLKVPGIQRVAIGDVEVCDAKPIGNGELLLTGASEGSTTLLVWSTVAGKTQRSEWTLAVTADPAHPGASREQDVVLVVGETRKLEFPNVGRVTVGDAAVADVRVGAGEVVLTGTSLGATTVLVYDKANQRQLVRVAVKSDARDGG